ncbi:MAG: beta-galactosidase [Clostridia bacterium]|jgi:beta-galactosidase/beta-glucuronidase|nr:beta-galactosidase [Clostridia bacterium]
MYRTEHPNPQFRRDSYECLNGTWEFETGKSYGKTNCALSSRIEVPFCIESVLSGIGKRELISDCVYSKTIVLTKEDLKGRVAVHFGAVDYLAEIYLNGNFICRHEGGYTPFEAELNAFAREGENRLTVAVHDDVRENTFSGKQTAKSEPFGCFYTRATGIWQTVWLERTPRAFIRSVRFYPDSEQAEVRAEIKTEGKGLVGMRVLYEGREVGTGEKEIAYGGSITVRLSEKHLWEAGAGRLYDVELTFGEDKVYSYFGLRKVRFDGHRFLLNEKSVFQRFVLDQGYDPQGIYTAPAAQAMERDIALARRLGFNGARLHQKVFEPLYLYYCDKAGFMVWGEFASWGISYDSLDAFGTFAEQWKEVIERDFNHPCIVQWCPLNEVWESLDEQKKPRDIRFVEGAYALTKALDETRPCVDVSGGYHGRHTDLFDFHCYHTAEEIAEYLKAIEEKGELIMDTVYPATPERGTRYNGTLPLNASEYGGIAYAADGKAKGLEKPVCCVQETESWGYLACGTEEEFARQYLAATELLLACPKLSGFCYTQLYDVEQERNGFYSYAREAKLSQETVRRIAECNAAIAAIEK